MVGKRFKELKEILCSLQEIEASFCVDFEYNLPRDLDETYKHVSIAAQHLDHYLHNDFLDNAIEMQKRNNEAPCGE